MSDAWRRGGRDDTDRSPLQRGDRRGQDGNRGEDDERSDRYIRLGVGLPSGDPAGHRVFEVRAAWSEAAGGWVARVGEQDRNEQLQGWGPRPDGGDRVRAFPTPAACLGDAVAGIVAMVDREAAGRP